MPRDGSGTASIVNSFSPGTVIASSEVNANFTDIASMLTGSLPIDGQAGMTGQIKAASGLVGTPGISFVGDLDTGIYRSGADTFVLVAGGVAIGTVSTSGFSATGSDDLAFVFASQVFG